MQTFQDDHSGSTLNPAIRGFIRTGGRILLSPDGELTEGGGVPKLLLDGSPSEAADCLRAAQAYFSERQRPGADKRILRVIRLLGRRTDNGWFVLGGSPAVEQPRGLH